MSVNGTLAPNSLLSPSATAYPLRAVAHTGLEGVTGCLRVADRHGPSKGWMQPSSPKSAAAVITVYTDIVVGLLTQDDAAQFEQAHQLFAKKAIFLPKTVLLEAKWILPSLYLLQPLRIIQALAALIAPPQVRSTTRVAVALDLTRQGLDFADALHLASCGAAERFLSFDRALIRGLAVAHRISRSLRHKLHGTS